ncbi:MAG: family 78 glycoside hydrolase catalytic domain [Clostridia bacterium]|nr:family 78 glycoside hydrolase catalytic domain [Clostridia bacterium]
MKIHQKCCDAVHPVGVVDPSFTWNIPECSGLYQTAYELWIYNDEYSWSSGRIESNQSVRVCCEDLELENNKKYYWTVQIDTNDGIYKSEADWFITGLAREEELTWITADPAISSPLLRKEFVLETVPEYSVINVCGLGFFELYINGKKVSDDIMQPVRSDYDEIIYRNLPNEFNATTRKSVYYLSYEVSEYLVKGSNTIVLWLGNGWYREKARATIRGDFDYGNYLKALVKLTAGDITIHTDETWQYIESPIVHNNLFSGEIYDARKFVPAFFQNGFVTGQFAKRIDVPKARLMPQLCPGERVIKTYHAKQIKTDIYDTGEVISGFAEIKLRGVAGEQIEIYYAENFDGDRLDYTSTVGYVEDDINQIQKDVYILDDSGVQNYTPQFIWHTYRYIYIKHSSDVEILSVDSMFVCTAMEKRANVACSNETVNAIYKLYQNTVLSNLHGATPLDCPHRERLPYTGDGQLSANAAMSNYDAYETYKKWITDICDAQDLDSGFVPYTAPYSGGCGGHAWGSAVVTVPWHHYLQYGDKRILVQAVPHIEKWIAYLKDHKDERGFIDRHVEGSWCLGDWAMPSKFPWSDPKPEAIKIHPRLVNTVYYIYCLLLLKKMYDELGWMIPTSLDEEINESRLVLSKEYVYTDDVFDEQEADVYLLFSDVITGRKAEKTLEQLVEKIEKRGYTFNSGMVATELLFKVLDKANRNDVVLKMLTASEYPSFGYMLKNGATTLWETWEGTGARSHTAFTSIGAWYVYGLAGIQPDRGYQTFTVKPFLAESLSYVDASQDTEYGKICVRWKRSGKRISLDISVPFNTTATLVIGEEIRKLSCGEHHFSLKG